MHLNWSLTSVFFGVVDHSRSVLSTQLGTAALLQASLMEHHLFTVAANLLSANLTSYTQDAHINGTGSPHTSSSDFRVLSRSSALDGQYLPLNNTSLSDLNLTRSSFSAASSLFLFFTPLPSASQ